jgi:stage II sporulation protein Q
MPKKYRIVALCMLLVVIGTVVAIKSIDNYENPNDIERSYQYTVVPSLSTDVPVTATTMNLIRPYKDSKVTIAIDYYEDEKNQEKSIIVTDNTYMQNVGVLYQADQKFDVYAILDGIVTEVGKNDLLGNYLKISHDNNIVSLYQILDKITVKKGDTIKQGTKIGESTKNNIKEGNLMLFELTINNKNVNPEKYYDKSIKEI